MEIIQSVEGHQLAELLGNRTGQIVVVQLPTKTELTNAHRSIAR